MSNENANLSPEARRVLGMLKALQIDGRPLKPRGAYATLQARGFKVEKRVRFESVPEAVLDAEMMAERMETGQPLGEPVRTAVAQLLALQYIEQRDCLSLPYGEYVLPSGWSVALEPMRGRPDGSLLVKCADPAGKLESGMLVHLASRPDMHTCYRLTREGLLAIDRDTTNERKQTDGMSIKAAARLYASLTGTQPDGSRVRKELKPGGHLRRPITEAQIARWAQATRARRRPAGRPAPTPSGFKCPKCGKPAPNLIGADRICALCFMERHGLT